ncbi:MAG TPA: BMC domain-containing protein, partial [Armatimonadetes bacterium]|nr:BMC domain-containing protein [Armatimonadota bacterium]
MEARRLALGVVEFDSIARGIEATDFMVKAAKVQLVAMRNLCPGKIWSAILGETAEVRAALSAGMEAGGEATVEGIVIPDVHPDVYPALVGATEVEEWEALGFVETLNPTAAVLSADRSAKSAEVRLV